jgi:hypothetical protein
VDKTELDLLSLFPLLPLSLSHSVFREIPSTTETLATPPPSIAADTHYN